MNLLDRMRVLIQGERALPLNPPRFGTGFASITPASDIDVSPIDSKKEAAQTYAGWVYAASTFIAEEMRALDYNLYRRTSVRREEWETDPRHPFNDILAQPNDSEDWGIFIERSVVSFNVAGEVYWHVTRSPGGRALGLQVVLPHWIDDPLFNREGQLRAWRVTVPGYAPRELPVEDVVRIYRPHPLSPWAAASTVEAAAVSHYFDLYVRAYGMTLFRNDGGIPAGLLSVPQAITTDQAEDLRERWRQRYSQARGEVAVLGEGADYKPIGIPMNDLKFLDIANLTRDQVLQLYRVPPSLLGSAGEVNRSSIDGHLYSFQRHALRPLAKRFEDAVNQRVLPLFVNQARRTYWWGFENVVAKDRTQIREEATTALTAGAMTINEYRQKMDLDPLPDGDVYTIPTGVTIKDTLTPQEPPVALEPPPDPMRDAMPRLQMVAAERRAQRVEEELAEVKRQDAERRTYQQLRGLFASWWADRTENTLPTRGLEQFHLTIEDLPDVKEDEDLLHWVERLKGKEGKKLAALSVSRA